ncbi:phage portal protein [Labrys sp. KNU-23]|uniref:phage portal protein n=1 Tax=Labrys sp. KNU-23 TaxID=2789216 RepID=UPI0011EE6B38|nr:phage portal protein [Labrys sp. KNU-23]QEN90838.1 phage portal protein [Labrys sp. KNU-23]
MDCWGTNRSLRSKCFFNGSWRPGSLTRQPPSPKPGLLSYLPLIEPIRSSQRANSPPGAGSGPVIVYKRTGDGKERASDHPIYRLLHDRAPPWTSATDFREQLARDALLHGDGLAFINRDSSGQPVELLRLASDVIQISQDDLTGEPSYKATTGSQRVFAASDIIHIKASSLDGYSGLSIVSSCKEATGLALIHAVDR